MSRFTPAKGFKNLAFVSTIFVSALSAHAQSSSTPVAKPPFSLTVFALPPQGLTNPDSITTANGKIYIVYANNTQPDGTGGTSTIVEYSMSGQMLRTFQVVGKADGLKYNPFDHKLWALRDEDSNPALTLIDPRSGEKTDFTYAQLPPTHAGGYDDVVFTKDATFISASNPQIPTGQTQNTFPSMGSLHAWNPG